MAYHSMSDTEVWEFLAEEPARTAKVATTRKDGRPHLAPVWYALDGPVLVFNTGSATVKGRTLLRDGRVSICVDDDRPPFSFVLLEGVAEVVDDLAQVRHWAAVIGGRYMGADRAQEYGDRNGVPGELLIRVRPTKITSARDLAS